MKPISEETRKVTMNLPVSLIDGLPEREHKTLTEIVREALKEYHHRRACQELLEMRGKVDFLLSYEELKDLR